MCQSAFGTRLYIRSSHRNIKAIHTDDDVPQLAWTWNWHATSVLERKGAAHRKPHMHQHAPDLQHWLHPMIQL